ALCLQGRGGRTAEGEEAEGHHWRGWLTRIAQRVVIDEKRRDEVLRRVYGVRASRVLGDEEGEGETAGAGEVELLVDESAWGDPHEWVERAEQVAVLAPVVADL